MITTPVRRSLLLSGAALLWAAGAAAQRPAPAAPRPSAAWGAFTRAFDAFLAADSVVGGSAVLVRDGRVVARADRGLADREPGPRQAVDDRTIFHYGSITKTLTAVAIMQLRDRGLLSLDDPVTRWVPELRQVHNPFGPVDAITVRMLLSHSAGFQNPTWPYRRYVAWEPFEPTRWEQLVAMMPYQEIRFAPGSRYGYSNPAFIYLARIIEALTGDPYQSYVFKNVWLPLGMTRSYFGATPWHLAADRSTNYTLTSDSAGLRVVANGRDFDPGITIPNGGWNAPLADVVTWAAFLTGTPRADSAAARRHAAVLDRRSLEEMWQPVVPVGPGEAMGLSFFLRPVRGDTLVGHTGEQAGFRSFLFFSARTREAVLLAVNTTNDARPQASAAAWERLQDALAELLVPRP
jgi:CubicO group peptidase (beta-lactamase class C family)